MTHARSRLTFISLFLLIRTNMLILAASPLSLSYQYAAEQIALYLGFFVLIIGLIGNTLNVIIFTSLRTFRETSCAFYLTVASLANIIHLLAGLLSRILISGYDIDLTETSVTLCKLRQYIAVIAPLMVVSSMVFAAVDQFCSLTIGWRRFSRRDVAWRLTLLTLVFWCTCNIPVILYHDIVRTSGTVPPCTIINPSFATYYAKFYVSALSGFLHMFLRIVFGLLAFFNVRRLARRHVPISRLERAKQITAMVRSISSRSVPHRSMVFSLEGFDRSIHRCSSLIAVRHLLHLFILSDDDQYRRYLALPADHCFHDDAELRNVCCKSFENVRSIIHQITHFRLDFTFIVVHRYAFENSWSTFYSVVDPIELLHKRRPIGPCR